MAQSTRSNKLLLKILIGAAWLDGTVQPEERRYLNKLARQHGLADDPEIVPLLGELRAVGARECYGWLEEYLGEQHDESDRERLIESLSALIYADSDVATDEARLLSRVQSSELPGTSPLDKALLRVQKLYRRVVSE